MWFAFLMACGLLTETFGGTLEPAEAAVTEPSTCDAKSDCAWDDECFPSACLLASQVGEPAECGEATPPPGECVCAEGACSLVVPCETWKDCDVALDPLRPILAYPKRTEQVKPCDDAERDAVCKGPKGAKTCQIVSWRC
jgi:hypothetical protein